jgi:hypothetical protein
MGQKTEGNGAGRRKRRSFTLEFKAEVVALVRQGDRLRGALLGSPRSGLTKLGTQE